MTKFEIVIRLTTNFLGSGKRINGVRKLERTETGSIKLPRKEILADIQELSRDDFTFKFEYSIEPNRTNILSRVYNKVRVDRFEGIESGTILSLFCDVPVSCKSQLYPIFKTLGAKKGISQWGRKFNCGRFKVITITKLE